MTTQIAYAKWRDLFYEEKPFLLLYDIPDDYDDKRTTNIIFEKIEKQVRDIRESKRKFTLDQNGFKIANHQTTVKAFKDRKIVDETYLPEIEQLLREEVEGVDQVFFFDWRVSIGGRPASLKLRLRIEQQVRESKDTSGDKLISSNENGANSVSAENSGTADDEVFDLNDYTHILLPAAYCHIGQSP